jgi:hypothetical protein
VLFSIWRRLFQRGFDSQRTIIDVGPSLADLARSAPTSWLMAQEKARLDYLAAKETYVREGSRSAFDTLLERLLQLESTNAIVGALLNEHHLERLITEDDSTMESPIGKSR